MSGTYLREDEWKRLKRYIDLISEGNPAWVKFTNISHGSPRDSYAVDFSQLHYTTGRSAGMLRQIKNTKSYEEYQEKYQKRLVPKFKMVSVRRVDEDELIYKSGMRWKYSEAVTNEELSDRLFQLERQVKAIEYLLRKK